MRIVFMGTPEFAVPSLEILLQNDFNVVGVVTAPDRPAGRGQKLQQSPVKEFALKHNLKVLQPEKLKSPEFLEELRALKPDLQVVVAFRMLPEAVWALPPRGTFNLHASLLPAYRGAAPINWAVINGEKETGVTTFFLRHAIDTGDIILQESTTIGPDETAGELHDRLMQLGAPAVLDSVQQIQSSRVQVFPQPSGQNFPPAPKIFKDDCRINWQQPLQRLHNFIRGLSPYPGAWTMLEGKTFKILRAKQEEAKHDLQPGSLHVEGDALKAAANGGFLNLQEVQLQGKRRMNASDFLRGNDVEGKVLE